MNDFDQGVVVGIIFSIIIAMIAIFFLVIPQNNIAKDKVQELGQSICDQEYHMDFDSYQDKQLKCKPKEIKAQVQYDGIVVQIK